VKSVIELKNVSKVYKSKKSIDTLALQDVSLKFQNSGMVFIVGKSGSGKSTLLNILGGLDSVTSGNVLVEGKNLSEFSTSELDSYRNTYVGFIFQEFNILEQYNVSENIEVSLRLQGKKQKNTDVLEILERLDLSGLGDRRINELSGGQKQRVSIGRALIKSPRLILADEPTGNLDLKSSKQIFDILKNISREHLVVVVSHDMESAKVYADRIIEIQDGKVISDTKQGDDISNGEITLVKSKLPLSYAFNMVLSSLKVKPLRLFMTVLLTAISLVFLGITMTLQMFDQNNLIINTMKDNGEHIYELGKTEFSMLGDNDLVLDIDDISYFDSELSTSLNLVYILYGDGKPLSFEFGEHEDNGYSNYYYALDPSNTLVVDVKDDRILGSVIGRRMNASDEIVVHKYFADYVIKYGIKSEEDLFKPNSYEELVDSDKYVLLGHNKLKIVGIIDDEDSLYEEARSSEFFDLDDDMELYKYFKENYASKGYYIYTKDFVNNINYVDDLEKAFLNTNYVVGVGMSFDNLRLSSGSVEISRNGETLNRELDEGEIVLSLDSFNSGLSFKNSFYEFLEQNKDRTYNDVMSEFASNYFNENFLDKEIILYDTQSGEEKPLKIVGLSLSDNSFISDKYINDFVPNKENIVSVKVYEEDESVLRNVFSKFLFRRQFNDVIGTYYTFSVMNSDKLFNVIVVYREVEWFIVAVCMVFLLFAFLLFSNFIGLTISNAKKEIGILRAIGAREVDVLKIYGTLSLVIALVSCVLGIIGWLVVCKIINYSIFGGLYFKLDGIVVRPLVAIMLLVFMISVSIFITVGSISKISKIKPIDAILNK